ncbi:hypothetical protein AB0I35_01340 [Nocardia sp. NPDC050378]|uniref:LppU family putative lipoprotein n=1 Tax=Nocardia sp. NPDC050378 TaxID=3155400 RepID=UPI0033C5A1A6
MFADLSIRRLAGALAISAFALGSSACGGTIDGYAQPAIDVVPATSSAAPTTKKPGKSTTSKPAPTTKKGGTTDFQASVGDCVNLGGTAEDATIEKASCGSRSANYKVIGKAPNRDGCIADSDQNYFETLDGVETGALCLDIDWVVGGCMDVAAEQLVARRIDCNASGNEPVRVVTIKSDATSANDCPDDADVGYVYDTRRFVVCAQTL